ncbi:MFS transporter [Pseudomonas syringae CC1557]|uniref:MFS transporter n=1 Tax=Pseudomonas syringae CC1557 TaxID=1357279 RepID=W0N158_PSESX|nr:MFS transporter [Pseudomonas syringae]AHG42821.1 MFS transporter [Pseudomonas syringae CC1557]
MTNTLPRRTYLYFTAQSINLTTAVMSVTMAAIVGSALAPDTRFSTVPYGFQFLLLMLATYPVSRLMSRIGRKKAFMLGAIPLVISGMSGFWAVEHQHFPALVFSHAALGVYIAFANFNRFAATDNLHQTLKPKAISLVVAGGVIAAIVGPTLTELLRDLGGYPLFSLCYASFIGLAALSLLIAVCLPDDPVMPSAISGNEKLETERQTLFTPTIVIAMTVAAVGYGVMNLLMIQASMHMKHMHQDFSDVRLAIQWHVIAMFAPSFFTGVIIQKIGIKTTICTGLILLIGCAAINMGSSSHKVVVFSLIILGLGWNLTYVGGGALLARAQQSNSGAMLMQGKNDLAIAILATIGAFTPSLLFSTVGWADTNAICMVLCIVLLVATAIQLKHAA